MLLGARTYARETVLGKHCCIEIFYKLCSVLPFKEFVTLLQVYEDIRRMQYVYTTYASGFFL